MCRLNFFFFLVVPLLPFSFRLLFIHFSFCVIMYRCFSCYWMLAAVLLVFEQFVRVKNQEELITLDSVLLLLLLLF